jgi:hypothetical protein
VNLLDLVTKGEVDKSRVAMKIDAKKLKAHKMKSESPQRGERRSKTLIFKYKDPTPEFNIGDLRKSG